MKLKREELIDLHYGKLLFLRCVDETFEVGLFLQVHECSKISGIVLLSVYNITLLRAELTTISCVYVIDE